ncbi:hypothetical protein B0H13DRAFT_1922189 [Mycena leptocephala]|nr:hypothetical protein B0H13DRAFT_1922189 [Mycena leptocephala]
MYGHRVRALLVPPQQGEGGDCWAIRHGEYKRSTDSYAHHDHGAHQRHRHSIRIRQAALRSHSASYDDRPREYDERGFSGIREKGYGKRSGGEVMADRERRRREAVLGRKRKDTDHGSLVCRRGGEAFVFALGSSARTPTRHAVKQDQEGEGKREGGSGNGEEQAVVDWA